MLLMKQKYKKKPYLLESIDRKISGYTWCYHHHRNRRHGRVHLGCNDFVEKLRSDRKISVGFVNHDKYDNYLITFTLVRNSLSTGTRWKAQRIPYLYLSFFPHKIPFIPCTKVKSFSFPFNQYMKVHLPCWLIFIKSDLMTVNKLNSTSTSTQLPLWTV